MNPYTQKTLGWIFGVALSVLFISMWGRVVVVDSDTLADAAAPLASSALVTDRVADWLQSELIESGVDSSLAGDAADAALASSTVDDVLETLVNDVIVAASAHGDGGSSVDVGAALAPAVPEISASLQAAGASLSGEQIASIIENLDPLVITVPGETASLGPSSELATRLGTATFLAALVLVGSGATLVMTSENRPVELRQLLERAALGGLSFAVLLRAGSWVLDPGGGRAPVSAAFSVILGEHWLVPLSVAVGAATGAAAVWVFVRKSRTGSGDRPGHGDEPKLDIAA